jgi:hypothetical protein
VNTSRLPTEPSSRTTGAAVESTDGDEDRDGAVLEEVVVRGVEADAAQVGDEGPAGPIRSVLVKPGKLAKAMGKGSGLGHTLAANPDPVSVLLAVGTQRDCMSFAGGKFVAGKQYLAMHDPPPAACP